MLFKKKKRRKEGANDGSVNITSLLDVLTVLLFFLIKSFNVSSSTIEPPKGVRLPASLSNSPAEDAIKISISRTELRIGNKIMVRMKNGAFYSRDIKQGGIVGPLVKHLEAIRDQRREQFKGIGNADKMHKGKLIILAHKNLPFGSISRVLTSVTSVGFLDYQFVVQSNKG